MPPSRRNLMVPDQTLVAKNLYGQHPGVVTQKELSEKLAAGWPAELGERPTVVMIQESPLAVANALESKRHRPRCNLFVLGKELRPSDLMDVKCQEAREKGVLFIRHPETQEPVVTTHGGKLAVS